MLWEDQGAQDHVGARPSGPSAPRVRGTVAAERDVREPPRSIQSFNEGTPVLLHVHPVWHPHLLDGDCHLAVQAKKMANTFSTRLHDVMGIDTSLPAVLESLNSSTPITSIGPGNTCTNESSALLTAQLSEPIDLIRDLAAAWDAGGLTTDLLQLLVALLNCWAVPAMLCTLRLLEPHAHPNVCACLHLCAHAA